MPIWNVCDLWNNQLIGEIPVELGGLAKLERLSLGGNMLTGEIPVELDGLTDLRVLSLVHNQLTGEIPEELGYLIYLKELRLEGDRLPTPSVTRREIQRPPPPCSAVLRRIA